MQPKPVTSDKAAAVSHLTPAAEKGAESNLHVLSSLIFGDAADSTRQQVPIEEVIKPFLETKSCGAAPLQFHYEYDYGDNSRIKVQYFAPDRRLAPRIEIDTDFPSADTTSSDDSAKPRSAARRSRPSKDAGRHCATEETSPKVDANSDQLPAPSSGKYMSSFDSLHSCAHLPFRPTAAT